MRGPFKMRFKTIYSLPTMYSLPICALLVCVLASCSGCGGSSEPPEMTSQVVEEIQQQDAAVADEESGM